MTDQKDSNQAVRELKWLDAKDPDPSIINVQELRGISYSLHETTTPRPDMCKMYSTNFRQKTLAYHPQWAKVPQYQLAQFHLNPVPI